MSSLHARSVADAMAALWEGEFPATVRVLSAVTDDRRSYRPDPKSRSAWELVVHIAVADAWFLDSIEQGVFRGSPVFGRCPMSTSRKIWTSSA